MVKDDGPHLCDDYLLLVYVAVEGRGAKEIDGPRRRNYSRPTALRRTV